MPETRRPFPPPWPPRPHAGVSPLRREALLALTDRREPRPGADERLRAVVIDGLAETPEQSPHLPDPRDDRLRGVTDLLHADPGRTATLAEPLLGLRLGLLERGPGSRQPPRSLPLSSGRLGESDVTAERDAGHHGRGRPGRS
ncbi:hypothetical protein ACQP2T_29950 [Nonomuraea sp. CA-143628]|uniref:hypothetical protein n=1 Tax=Nonomuraea sp. CA-143628 TaxID=3239997 RepID=UPI003D8F4BB4